MTYVVQNSSNFQAAFSGALAGLGFGGRSPHTTDPAQFDSVMSTANAFAEAVDTVLGSGVLAGAILNALTPMCAASFQGRAPDSALVAADFSDLATSVALGLEALFDFYETHSIPVDNTSTSVVKQIQSDVVAAPGFGTITQGDAAKVVNTVNITTSGGDLKIEGVISGNGGVHNGNAVLTIQVDGVDTAFQSLESWVSADDVSRNIKVLGVVTGISPGAHVITTTIVISAGAAGTTFTNAETDVLVVTEFLNQP